MCFAISFASASAFASPSASISVSVWTVFGWLLVLVAWLLSDIYRYSSPPFTTCICWKCCVAVCSLRFVILLPRQDDSQGKKKVETPSILCILLCAEFEFNFWRWKVFNLVIWRLFWSFVNLHPFPWAPFKPFPSCCYCCRICWYSWYLAKSNPRYISASWLA